jgi:hypothetical protein
MAGRLKRAVKAWARSGARELPGRRVRQDIRAKQKRGELGAYKLVGIASTSRMEIQFTEMLAIHDRKGKLQSNVPLYRATPRDRNKYTPKSCIQHVRKARRAQLRGVSVQV